MLGIQVALRAVCFQNDKCDHTKPPKIMTWKLGFFQTWEKLHANLSFDPHSLPHMTCRRAAQTDPVPLYMPQIPLWRIWGCPWKWTSFCKEEGQSQCFSPRSTKHKNTCHSISSHTVSSTLNTCPSSQFYEHQGQTSPPRSVPWLPSAQLWRWSSTSQRTVSPPHHWPWECTYEGRAEMGGPASRGPQSGLCSPLGPWECENSDLTPQCFSWESRQWEFSTKSSHFQSNSHF